MRLYDNVLVHFTTSLLQFSCWSRLSSDLCKIEKVVVLHIVNVSNVIFIRYTVIHYKRSDCVDQFNIKNKKNSQMSISTVTSMLRCHEFLKIVPTKVSDVALERVSNNSNSRRKCNFVPSPQPSREERSGDYSHRRPTRAHHPFAPQSLKQIS